MKKRIFSLLLAGALSLTLLAACGGGDSGGSVGSTPSGSPSAPVEPSDAPSPSPSGEPENTPALETAPDPSPEPSGEPSAAPSQAPSLTPSQTPSQKPAPATPAPASPTPAPASKPTPAPTPAPTPTSTPTPTPKPTPAPTPAASADLTKFYAALCSSYELPMLMEVPGDIVADIYPGLEAIPLKQQVLYTAAISAVAAEIAIVETENADDAARAAAVFQARVNAQVDGGAWYPATIESWEKNSQIVTCGNYVLLIVNEQHAAIAADFKAFVG